MVAPLRIGVMGAGSIGAFVGGRLAAAGRPVILVGRPRLQQEVAEHGLWVQELDEPPVRVPAENVDVHTEAAALAGCDVVLVATKSAQTAEVARELDAVIGPSTLVVSLQNGVGNPAVLRENLGARPVQAAIVDFNVVSRGEGRFHRALTGPLVLQALDDERARRLEEAFVEAGFAVKVRADLAPDQWTKLLVNLNNAVSALSDAPTRELLLQPGYRRVIAALVGEALSVVRAAGIRPARLRGLPIGVMPWLLGLPTPVVKAVTGRQFKMNPDARSSMWEDLTRGRPTEVDWLNGEIVRLAEQRGRDAPLNRRIVELVHEAERAGAGSPGLPGDELWARLTAR